MNTSFFVENIKCGGCSNSIKSKLEGMVSDVSIDIENGSVAFSYEDESKLEEVRTTLEKMGYPEIGKSKFSHKAKSYVSCMMGRVK